MMIFLTINSMRSAYNNPKREIYRGENTFIKQKQ